MAFIRYVDECELPATARVPDPDNTLQIHAVHAGARDQQSRRHSLCSSVTPALCRERTASRIEPARPGRLCAVSVALVWLALLAAVDAGGQTPKIDTSKIGPQIGARVSAFSGTDQFGRHHALASSIGANGAMLVFFRSADW